jgi:NAD(P)-dependent dehydrogenase (short-subunit alcohol dehydrogenase family)
LNAARAGSWHHRANCQAHGALARKAFWDEMNTNVMGGLRCVRAVAPIVTGRGWCRIISLGGLAARGRRASPRVHARRAWHPCRGEPA